MQRSHPDALRYSPILAWTSLFGGVWVFVLVTLGAFTTSIGAGMAFPDWPLSNGSLNPNGWLQNLAMFAEHSHRLSAGIMTLVTVVVAVMVWRNDQRPWLRKLALFAALLIVTQAVIGGLRVLLDKHLIVSWETTVGRLFAMLHAVTAQLYVCIMAGIAAASSRRWVRFEGGSTATGDEARVRKFGRIFLAVLLVQLVVAAVMRHSLAGLAIPTFPYSNPHGGWLPDQWDFRVGIHFAHRCLALAITVFSVVFAATAVRCPSLPASIKWGACLLVALVLIQATLGAAVVLQGRSPDLATAHVFFGALLLASAFLLTWVLHRSVLEQDGAREPMPRASKAASLHAYQT